MNSSNSSNEKSGNTKQISPSKRWCFTLNNYKKEDISSISSNSSINSYIIGEEVGEKGTPHLQGYIEFKEKKRPLGVFKEFNNIHWEKAKGSRLDNINYCSKDCKYHTNMKIKKPLKKLFDKLYDWEEEMIEIIKTEPNDRDIYWYFDEKCGAGKTTFCKYLIRNHDAIVLGGKSSDMKNGIISYIEKNNGCHPELILVNLPKTFDTGYLSYTGIEECKDMMFYSGKYEGGMVDGNCPHMIIFSNELPDLDKCDKSRWKIKDMNKKKWLDENDKNLIAFYKD